MIYCILKYLNNSLKNKMKKKKIFVYIYICFSD